jgi:MFS family permease
LTAALRASLSSLEVPNYRRFFGGQVVSLAGNWMQIVAEMWLILSLTGSGVYVGLTSALQFLPFLLIGAWGGLLADRMPKRRLLLVTQTAMALPPLALLAITVTGVVEPWMVLGLVFMRGTANAIDYPTRQAFVIEIVGEDRVVNVIGLNSVIVHAARIIGPALAGIVIALWGVEPCFAVNALTFAVMIACLWAMNPAELRPSPPGGRHPGGVRRALAYVRGTPALAIPLALMALVGTLGFNFQVIIPLLARFTFEGGATAYGLLAAAMAAGSVVAALVVGARGRVTTRLIAASSLAFGVAALAAAAAPDLITEAVLLAVLGAASVTFGTQINSWLQLAVEPRMRGRVMALYSIVFLGSTPVGGPIAGWLAEAVDPRATLVMAAGAALLAAVAGRIAFARYAVPATPEVAPIPDAVVALRPRRDTECPDEGRSRIPRLRVSRRIGSRSP